MSDPSRVSDALEALEFALEQMNAPKCAHCDGSGQAWYEKELYGSATDISPPTRWVLGECDDCMGIGLEWWFKPGGTA